MNLTPRKRKAKHGGPRPNSGRKPAHVEADLSALMDDAWPYAARVAVIQALNEAARNGNVQAATALLDRALGKPIERQMVDREANDALVIKVEYADLEPGA
jgi:hypothetical protein